MMKCIFKISSFFLLFSFIKEYLSHDLSSFNKKNPPDSLSEKLVHKNSSEEGVLEEEYDEYFLLSNNSNLTNLGGKKVLTSRQFYQLRRKLLLYYDSSSRPISDSSKSIEVGLSVIVKQINDLDGVYQV